MSKKESIPVNLNVAVLLSSIVMAFTTLLYFSGHYKILTILAGLGCFYLLLRRDLTPLRSIPALLLLTYVVFSGLTRFWAISGKFFLIEYSELFTATALFLGVVLQPKFDRDFVRKIMQILAGVSTIYSLLSVEAATTGISNTILMQMPGYQGLSTGFETGTRLTGILGNANVLSSVVALGIFCSICLLCGEENKNTRFVYAGLSAVNAFVFLLLFSMGGTACFILSVFFYLIFAGKHRSGVLIRMLECAVPTILWVFVAFPFFNQEGAVVMIPLCAMAGNIITVILLEKLLGAHLTEILSKHSKLTMSIFAGVIALACVYVVLGVSMTGAYTFDEDSMRRGAYPEAGTHTLSIQANEPVNVTVISQDMSQVMMHTNTVLYRGDADNASFTVPENSEVCYFTFTAAEGTVLEEAVLGSGEELKLNYTLLPGFIANRLQGLKANQNAIQRTVFFRDGMKMFYQSPVVGNGVGSFETGVTSVQEFMYTTKYIHNHYIQILLEAGSVGMILFTSSVAGMLWLLWKRRKDENWEYSMEYPALWAMLVMTLSHIAVEVSMSMIVFSWMAFVVFGLVVRCCSSAIQEEESKSGGKLRVVVAVLPIVFVVSLCCNIMADHMSNSPAQSLEGALQKIELAAAIDPYEGNDAKLTYVVQTYRNDLSHHVPTADKYAAQLLKVQSNSIPLYLMEYYVYREQYDQLFQAARFAATYSASNPAVWNQAISTMVYSLLGNSDSPLYSEEQRGAIVDELMNYYDLLREHNRSSMETIELAPMSKDFFSRLLALKQTDLSYDSFATMIYFYLFDASACCDADDDQIPDQVIAYGDVDFAENMIKFLPNGSMKLEMYNRRYEVPVNITITCESPETITVVDKNGNTIQGGVSNGAWIGEFTQDQDGSPEMYLTITSSEAQVVENICVMSAE